MSPPTSSPIMDRRKVATRPSSRTMADVAIVVLLKGLPKKGEFSLTTTCLDLLRIDVPLQGIGPGDCTFSCRHSFEAPSYVHARQTRRSLSTDKSAFKRCHGASAGVSFNNSA